MRSLALVVTAVGVGVNLAFVALNAYMFATAGRHWYSLAALGLSAGAAAFCLWLAVRP